MSLDKIPRLTSKIKNLVLEFVKKSKQFDEVKFYETLLVVSLIIFLISIVLFWPGNDFGQNIRVEFVGFCLDVFLLGLIYAIFKRRNERDQDIKRWQEEIDDYRGWDGKEATYRIVGNIKRLNRVGVTKINLRGCYLASAYLFEFNLEGADLRMANLEGADLRIANLENADLSEASLKSARFDGANLKNASFGHSHLEGASLTDSHLEGAKFYKARLAGAFFMGATNLEDADFSFSYLGGAHFDNIGWLDEFQKKDAEKKGVKPFLKYFTEPSILGFGFTIRSKTPE